MIGGNCFNQHTREPQIIEFAFHPWVLFNMNPVEGEQVQQKGECKVQFYHTIIIITISQGKVLVIATV